MANDEIFEEANVVVLTNENGEEEEFEFLHLMEYQGKEYVFLVPMDEDVPEVIILEVESSDNEDEDNYVGVDDDELLNTLFQMFKEEFADDFNFVD